jgi:hypothetical protein
LLYGVAVGVKDPWLTSKGAHQHQQSGLREVKVGKQRASYTELISGVDEYVRLATAWLNFSGRLC